MDLEAWGLKKLDTAEQLTLSLFFQAFYVIIMPRLHTCY